MLAVFSPEAFPNLGPIFPERLSFPEKIPNLAGIACPLLPASLGGIAWTVKKPSGEVLSRPKLYTARPSPISGHKAFLRQGGGDIISRPPATGVLYTPPFYTPPTPRRVFSGMGAWACIKFGPVFSRSDFGTASAFLSCLTLLQESHAVHPNKSSRS